MSAILGLLAGALITFAANIALQRWKYGREAIDRRCDEIEKATFDLSTVSREYWLRPWPATGGEGSLSASLIDLEFFATQARMVGLSQRIQGLNAIVISDFESDERKAVLRSLAVVLDQATGGRFEVKGRRQDFERARGVEAACADYTVLLRSLATSRWHWSVTWKKTAAPLFSRWSRFENLLDRPCAWLLRKLDFLRSR